MDYEDRREDLYAVFEGRTSSREVELTCAIQPGALSQNYHARWLQTNPTTSAITFITTEEFSIIESVPADLTDTYHCQVTIQHSDDVNVMYNGPEITINKNGEFGLNITCIIQCRCVCGVCGLLLGNV